MSEYTVVVEAGNADGTIWQSLAPAETATGETAEAVSEWAATNQTLADGGHWRVRVWDGPDADTASEPDAEHYHNDES